MIIGNNNFNNQNFSNKMKSIKENNELNKNRVGINKVDNHALFQGDVMSKKDMDDKAFAMLQDRYNNGLISLDEFTKQCRKLEKQRNK